MPTTRTSEAARIVTGAAGGAALLVIDMQNGFCKPGGSLPRAGLTLPGVGAAVAQTAAMLAAVREAGGPVIYTRHVFRPGQVDRPARLNSAFPRVPAPLVRGSWDADVVPALAPRDRDVVIDKNRYDAFLYTDLELVLRALAVNRLIVAGVVTHACVESTVRSAVQRDFDVHVAADCVAGPGPFHDHSLAVLAASFARVAPWRELMPVMDRSMISR
jgi:ureidoacrylate peracid hydrolase